MTILELLRMQRQWRRTERHEGCRRFGWYWQDRGGRVQGGDLQAVAHPPRGLRNQAR